MKRFLMTVALLLAGCGVSLEDGGVQSTPQGQAAPARSVLAPGIYSGTVSCETRITDDLGTEISLSEFPLTVVIGERGFPMFWGGVEVFVGQRSDEEPRGIIPQSTVTSVILSVNGVLVESDLEALREDGTMLTGTGSDALTANGSALNIRSANLLSGDNIGMVTSCWGTLR